MAGEGDIVLGGWMHAGGPFRLFRGRLPPNVGLQFL